MSEFEIKKTILDPKTFQQHVSDIDFPLISFSLCISSVLFCLLVSYFLVTAGVIYDIIVEPPSVGQ